MKREILSEFPTPRGRFPIFLRPDRFCGLTPRLSKSFHQTPSIHFDRQRFLVHITMSKFPTIHDFFPVIAAQPLPGRTTPQNGINPGDGFTFEDFPNKAAENAALTHKKLNISDLRLGMTDVSVTGKVVNIQGPRSQSQSKAPREGGTVKFEFTIRDDTGVFQARIWPTEPIQRHNIIGNMKLGMVYTLIINFLTTIEAQDIPHSPSTIPVFASFSEADIQTRIFSHNDSTSSETSFDLPLACISAPHMGRFTLLELGNADELDTTKIQLMVCVRFIGPRKRDVPLKDGRAGDKAEVGVFDETTEGILTLWGMTAPSINTWIPGKTVLLITRPKITKWNNIIQIKITKNSLIEINPTNRDAEWLRSSARNHSQKSIAKYTFPLTGPDWDSAYNTNRKLFTLRELDSRARNSTNTPPEEHIGMLSVLIQELKLCSMYKKQMMTCGYCCGREIFSNGPQSTCITCHQLVTLRLNPKIIGNVRDETGCIQSGYLILSDMAWSSLLGRSVEEIIATQDPQQLESLDHRIRESRVTMIFAWSLERGRIAVWKIM
ncbi:hypothetical protein DFH27DRAFT_113783 [Peziza echinospora]|nr:hypothetical protein DFH27DRAFT_113783 [Peziza echinospora]